MSKDFFITKKNWAEFLKGIAIDYEVVVPVKKGQQRFYRKFTYPEGDFVIAEVRTFEPLKVFFSRARETVAEGFRDSIPPLSSKPFAIVGVKACDLKGFKIQDFVFYPEGQHDPIYARNREANVVISADCSCAIDTCFCLALGVQPFPRENYDINISQVAAGFVVSPGSSKGEKILQRCPGLFEDPSSEMLSERRSIRESVLRAVEKNLHDHKVPLENNFPGVVQRNFNSDIWSDEAKKCVECGACNTICPTCHCFLLYDQRAGEGAVASNTGEDFQMKRFRVFDSCMIKDFARVAGGGNPRAKLWMRLRNRFEKKFDFFPKVAGINACTGCGRCISACPAKIDIRKVLRRLVDNG